MPRLILNEFIIPQKPYGSRSRYIQRNLDEYASSSVVSANITTLGVDRTHWYIHTTTGRDIGKVENFTKEITFIPLILFPRRTFTFNWNRELYRQRQFPAPSCDWSLTWTKHNVPCGMPLLICIESNKLFAMLTTCLPSLRKDFSQRSGFLRTPCVKQNLMAERSPLCLWSTQPNALAKSTYVTTVFQSLETISTNDTTASIVDFFLTPIPKKVGFIVVYIH